MNTELRKITRECAVVGFTLHTDRPDLGLQIFTREVNGKLWAKGFVGKAGKPAFFYTFKNLEQFNKHAAAFIAAREHTLALRAEEKQRAATPVKVTVGDIFRASWGYDQTNIDFYQVTRVVGKSTVEICEIAWESEETGFMSGRCAPMVDGFIGKPMIKRFRNSGGTAVIRIDHTHAYQMAPKAVVGGITVYGSSHWSSYA